MVLPADVVGEIQGGGETIVLVGPLPEPEPLFAWRGKGRGYGEG
jgi:hypothetical protein